MDGLLSIILYVMSLVVLFLIIFYAVKFAFIEAHREINEQADKAGNHKNSL